MYLKNLGLILLYFYSSYLFLLDFIFVPRALHTLVLDFSPSDFNPLGPNLDLGPSYLIVGSPSDFRPLQPQPFRFTLGFTPLCLKLIPVAVLANV